MPTIIPIASDIARPAAIEALIEHHGLRQQRDAEQTGIARDREPNCPMVSDCRLSYFLAMTALCAASLALLVLATACAQPENPKAPPPTTVPTAKTDMNEPKETAPVALETATLAGGCFWCIEAVLDRLDGVADVESGYMGGSTDNPTYKQICTGSTGHAEVVQVKFDPSVISYTQLLGYFFALHDPTTLNRQGNDVGTQYRSAIFFHSEEQQQAALAAIKKAQAAFGDPIVTEVTQVEKLWTAEGYHQDYWQKNPGDRYCNAFIPSKLKKLGLEK